MDDTNSLIEQRKAKLAALRAKGIDPFMNKFTPTPDLGCGAAREKFEKGELVEGQAVALAGRITAHRDMGKSQFIDLKDVTGRVQVYAQKQALGDEQFEVFSHLDLADFIGVKGTMFRTRAGEISVKAESFTVLAKALRPPPDKWDGLADTEVRYRQRYLDLIASSPWSKEQLEEFAEKKIKPRSPFVEGSALDVALMRSRIIREIRAFFHDRRYVEVETPMMQAIPGGAAAQPFKTHHNALGCEFFLRIALELYLKRLLVGGVDKVFEIGRNFRNEGLSRKHNPEFTMLEAYEAFGDYGTMMETVESLVCQVAEQVVGTLKIVHQRPNEVHDALGSAYSEILFPPESIEPTENEQKVAAYVAWQKDGPLSQEISELKNLRRNCTGSTSAAAGVIVVERAINVLQSLGGEFAAVAALLSGWILSDLRRLAIPREINLTRPWRQARYKDLVREEAGADWFDITPAERRRRAIEDLELSGDIAAGYEDFEVTGAVFEKLVEPTLIQPTFVTHLPKELVPLAKLSPDDPTTVEVFECCINGQEISPGYTEQNDPIAQRATLEHQAGGEQQKLDEDFIVALEHGMPPAGGIGIGIDRLCMMLLGQESIRDVILFPQLKPKA